MLIVPAFVVDATFDGSTLFARLSAIIFFDTPVITYCPSSFLTLFLVEAGCLIKLAKSGLPETPLVDSFRFAVPILLLRSLDLTERFPVLIA